MNQEDKKKYDETLAYIEEFWDSRDPMPADPIARILLPYFDHPYDYIHAKPKKRKGKLRWRTEKRHPLLKRNLWIDWNSEDTIIGLGFGNFTRRIMIDIDIDSPYHPNNNEKAYHKVLHTLEDLGLCSPLTLESSWSEGLHIYYFLSKGVPSYYASKCVQTALRGAKFELKNGYLEVFPNMKPYGDSKKGEYTTYKAHRLPLQPRTGSFILSTFSLECKGQSLKHFAHMVEAANLRPKKK